MSIDTLLEAARYLEWQAQQQQIAREEEQRREKELLSREESRRMEVAATLSSQPIRANHVVWGDGHHRQQQPPLPQQQQQPRHPSPAPPVPPPPPPSLPPSQVPITVIPMVPVVTASPSVPPLPVTGATMAVATAIHSSAPPIKNGHAPSSSPPQQQSAPRHLLCAPQVKVEPVSPPLSGGVKPVQPMQPQVQIPYASPIAAAAPGSQHALLPQQAQPNAALQQQRTNGLTVDDMRTLDGKRRPGGAGTREVHNKLEKNRRAHLKECFETLKKNVPNVDEKKTSNLSVLRSALRYIQTLKRKEKEYEHEMERLAREKIATQQRLAELKKELSQCMDITEIDRVLRQTVQPEDDQVSTSTASEGEDNFDQDIEEDESPVPRPPPSLPKPIAPLLQAPPLLAPHLSIQHATALPLSGVLTATAPSPATTGPSPHHAPQPIAPAPPPPPPAAVSTTLTLAPAPATMQVQPTVIAHHAAVSHASVIQAVNHVAALPPAANTHKHLTHIAPSPGPSASSSVVVPSQPSIVAAPLTVTAPNAHHHHHHQMTHHPQPIGHITVHPVAHLGGPLPQHLSTVSTLYPQGAVAVSQGGSTTVVGHITHTFTHLPAHVHAASHTATQISTGATAVMSGQGGGGGGGQSLGKPTAVLAPHPHQLVGQATVLNPVTMVTVPQFPVSTLKLA